MPAKDDLPSITPSNILDNERRLSNLNAEHHRDELVALLGRVDSSSEEANKAAMEKLDKIPHFKHHPIYHTSRLNHFIHALELSNYAFKHIKQFKMNPKVPEDPVFTRYISGKVDEPIPLFMHYVMFVPCLENQADDEQRNWWLDKAMRAEMLGCYAQTEIGHGSNVRGILTRATFDRDTDSFVLNTPCLEACKFWVGALGKCATHGVVMADLIIPQEDGSEKSYGVHPFMVPLRDPDTFDCFKGVHIWDIGDKWNFHAMDNGMMRFDNYSIPRRNMLMRFAKVSSSGEYTRPAVDKLQYGTMVSTRAYLVSDAARYLVKSCVIATRYSAQRRQFWSKGDDGREQVAPQKGPSETPVINYLTQQSRLFPMIADSFTYVFTGQYMRTMYVKLMNEMKNGDFSSLAELHATTAGLKSFVTARVLSGIDVCRKACGGHGYSKLSGLPQVLGDFGAKSIAEGEEYVMSFQTGRYCLKMFSKVLSGKDVKLGETVRYMADVRSVLGSTLNVSSVDDLLADPFEQEDTDPLISILRYKCLQTLSVAAEKLQRLKQNDDEVVGSIDNEMGTDFYKICNAHCICTAALCFKRQSEHIKKLSPESRKAVTALYQLYCLSRIEEDFSPYLVEGFMNKDQMLLVRQAIRKLLRIIRPDAIPLTDGFDIPDELLRSVLGRYNGEAYKHLYEGAKNSEFNHGKNDRMLKVHLMRQIHPILRSKI